MAAAPSFIGEITSTLMWMSTSTSTLMWMSPLSVIHGHGSNGEYFSAMKCKRMDIDGATLHCHFVSNIHAPDQLVLVHVPCRDADAAMQLAHAIQVHLGRKLVFPRKDCVNIVQYQRIEANALRLPPADVADEVAKLTLGADMQH